MIYFIIFSEFLIKVNLKLHKNYLSIIHNFCQSKYNYLTIKKLTLYLFSK